MMDPYELIRRLSFSTTPGYMSQDDSPKFEEPTHELSGVPQQFSPQGMGMNLADQGNGLFRTSLQNPGMGKYDLLYADYRIDPETGQATMEGDPTAYTRPSDSNRRWSSLAKGAAFTGALLGGAAGLDTLLYGSIGGGMAASGAASGAAGGAAGVGIGTMPGLSAANLAPVPGISAASLPSTVGMSSLPNLATIGAGVGGAAGGGGVSTMGGLSPANLSPVAGIPASSIPQTIGGMSALPSLPSLSSMGQAGGLLGQLKNAVSNNPLQAAAIGLGAIGGAQGGGDVTSTSQSRTDPRLDPYLYGDQGILKAASDWYSQNKSGANDTMRAGWNQQLGLLQDPRTMQGLQGLQQGAQGLLGTPIAGNPFMRGG